MSDEEMVRGLDQARRSAMIAADVATLNRLFDENMAWVHATARADTKARVLDAIGSGATRYLSIHVADEQYRQFGDTALLSGVATMKLEIRGEVRDLENRYTIVWHASRGAWRVIHWQSTALRGAS